MDWEVSDWQSNVDLTEAIREAQAQLLFEDEPDRNARAYDGYGDEQKPKPIRFAVERGEKQMSWNKNTIKMSEVDATIRTLHNMRMPHEVKILGYAKGMGLNDFDSEDGYEIRRLEYNDVVLLEQMIRHSDCDADDIIISEEFKKDEVPDNWKIEVEIEDEWEMLSEEGTEQ